MNFNLYSKGHKVVTLLSHTAQGRENATSSPTAIIFSASEQRWWIQDQRAVTMETATNKRHVWDVTSFHVRFISTCAGFFVCALWVFCISNLLVALWDQIRWFQIPLAEDGSPRQRKLGGEGQQQLLTLHAVFLYSYYCSFPVRICFRNGSFTNESTPVCHFSHL